MALDIAPTESFRIIEPRKVFQLTSNDLELINSNQDQIIELMNHPDPFNLPPVGKHWQRATPFSLSRGEDKPVPIIIKKPWGTMPARELFGHILKNESRLISQGVDCFVPTYPVGVLDKTGLFVQYYAVEKLPDNIPYSELKRNYQKYLASLGVGVKDFENNAIYTEHGWALFDVEDVV